MSDLDKEAQKVLDELKEGINKPLEVPEDKFDTFILYNIESAKTILNLIEKQSKEIEELKEDNEHQWEERCKLTFELENSISNDKIKAKIKELDKEEKEELKGTKGQDRYAIKQKYMHKRSVLQSLLEKE